MRRWTDKERKVLFDGIGSLGWSTLERRTGRTRAAIWAQVRRHYGGGGITRGCYSLAQAIQETGYSASQLRRASTALNQRWARTSGTGNYLIQAEQLEECAAWLLLDFWSVQHRLYCCVGCATTQRPHHSKGLCCACYRRTTRYMAEQGIDLTAQMVPQDMLPSGDVIFWASTQARITRGILPGRADLRRFVGLCR